MECDPVNLSPVPNPAWESSQMLLFTSRACFKFTQKLYSKLLHLHSSLRNKIASQLFLICTYIRRLKFKYKQTMHDVYNTLVEKKMFECRM